MVNLRTLYRWVPTTYLIEGLPFALVAIVSVVLYKNFDFSNTKIALYTSLFTVPWIIKPLLAPLFEPFASKRTMVVLMQLLMAILFLLLAASLYLHNFFYLTGIIFLAIACCSTLHDMNLDGFYIISLNQQEQAHFIGVRTITYQIGRLIGQSGLVFVAGWLIFYVNEKSAWQIALTALAGMTGVIAFYHHKIMPKTETNITLSAVAPTAAIVSFKKVFIELLTFKHFIAIIIFTLSYDFAQTQLNKIVPLFLLDKVLKGGLGLTIKQVGTVFGGISIVGILVGITLAGFLLAKKSLKSCLVPLTILAALSNTGYLLLVAPISHSIALISIIILISQFGFGLSNGAYMFYLLQIFSKGNYPMSLYAIGTSLMGIGVTLGGAVSGYMQYKLGYTGFFIWILIVNFGIILSAVYNKKKVL